ncbi:Aromatic-L-amino-acid decarboxylase [Amphibalanus amphitrite]|uniref:Aromatic-L-amino-acid decarboxylase n=1 Tax=Amphibalanus amphitrite TaxID=1232801 RepID=A0A6A4V269_AMPAM|nr:Aromatic-L-amino-acid decarboxylase [Amphibalanus amphitrite]
MFFTSTCANRRHGSGHPAGHDPLGTLGTLGWHSLHFHAFCPLANSPPALLAEMLAHGLSCVGLSWEAAPACLELELAVLDWLVTMT